MGNKVIISNKREDFSKELATKSIYEAQLLELAEIRKPSLAKAELELLANRLRGEIQPIYAYYSWHSIVIEMLPEQEFLEIKTNRNQLLVSKEEQSKLYNTKISIAGMSVGSALLFGLVGSGFGNQLLLADDDLFSNSNLNRVQATILDIGEDKAAVSKRRALEMNPFLNVTLLEGRIRADNITEFMMDGKCDVIFEEIDDFKIKVILRDEAKKRQVPLIMLTNLGDSVMIDVERYDTQPNTEPFNGLVDQDLLENIRRTIRIDQETMKQLSMALVDRRLVPEKAAKSLELIGHTLVGRPQLYGTVAMDGGVAPYLLRKLVLGDDLASGRYSLELDGIS